MPRSYKSRVRQADLLSRLAHQSLSSIDDLNGMLGTETVSDDTSHYAYEHGGTPPSGIHESLAYFTVTQQKIQSIRNMRQG